MNKYIVSVNPILIEQVHPDTKKAVDNQQLFLFECGGEIGI
ncbi:hypothetical protein THOB06_40235 [Vibrio rotiferianus]|nr:hypothetical protein THOG10_40236 [Vibrio rotiferianus]CAH1589567.1 hypothetical protein THOB06_40235 [Vibrio rotiferianus]